jgi:hypothetical protein
MISHFFRALSLCFSISCLSSYVRLFPSMLHCSASNYLFLVLTFFLSYFLSFSSRFLAHASIHFFCIQAFFIPCVTLLFQLILSLCKLDLLSYIMCRNGVHTCRYTDNVSLFEPNIFLLLIPFFVFLFSLYTTRASPVGIPRDIYSTFFFCYVTSSILVL